MAAPLILARTFSDAHEFARGELGLEPGHYQVVTSSASIGGRHGVDLYLVPGYEGRYDRFAMRGALRYTRLNVIDVAKMRAEALAEDPDGLNPPGTQPSITEGADPALVAEFEAFLTGNAEHQHEQDAPSWSIGCCAMAAFNDGQMHDPDCEQTEVSDAHELVTAGVAEEETAGTPESAAGDPIDDAHGVTEVLAEKLAAEDTTKRRRRRCKECGILVEPDEVETHAAEHLPTEQ